MYSTFFFAEIFVSLLLELSEVTFQLQIHVSYHRYKLLCVKLHQVFLFVLAFTVIFKIEEFSNIYGNGLKWLI